MTVEHVPQATYDAKEIQPVKKEEIEDKDEIPEDELSHPSTLTPSSQDVYGMDGLRNNRKREYSYRFASVMHC